MHYDCFSDVDSLIRIIYANKINSKIVLLLLLLQIKERISFYPLWFCIWYRQKKSGLCDNDSWTQCEKRVPVNLKCSLAYLVVVSGKNRLKLFITDGQYWSKDNYYYYNGKPCNLYYLANYHEQIYKMTLILQQLRFITFYIPSTVLR